MDLPHRLGSVASEYCDGVGDATRSSVPRPRVVTERVDEDVIQRFGHYIDDDLGGSLTATALGKARGDIIHLLLQC